MEWDHYSRVSINKDFEYLVDALKSLPGVGTKNAKKWAFFLLNQDLKYINDFTKRIINAKTNIKKCTQCSNFCENKVCDICSNEHRNKKTLMIVSNIEDLERIESSNVFNGLYHITGGEISIRKSVPVEHTNITTIRNRVIDNEINDVIIATSFSHDGEMTADYILRMLSDLNDVNVYRIGFGIPLNASIDYADDETIKQSLLNKRMLIK